MLSPVIYNFPSTATPVRVIMMQDGEPWFIASDVCAALNHSNTSMAISGLDEDEKGISNVYTLGGAQNLIVVSESGLYSLILTSRKPEAKVFKRWLTHEVLPSIRKTGSYATDEGPSRGWASRLVDFCDLHGIDPGEFVRGLRTKAILRRS